MFHKNNSPNRTKKSSGLLKDWWSILLSCFFSCFNSWKATVAIFRQSAGYILGVLFFGNKSFEHLLAII